MSSFGTVKEISKRYALALYDLAYDHNQIDPIHAELSTLQQIISQSTALQKVMRSPVITPTVQAKVVQMILDRMAISDLTKNFVSVVIHNHRLSLLDRMIDSFDATVKERRGHVHVEMTVARPLTAKQHEILRTTLITSLQCTTIDSHITVDSSLLQGIRLKIGSWMIDNTLQSKLNILQRTVTAFDERIT